MNWRTDLLAVLANELGNWTPKTWYRRLLKNLLMTALMKEISEEKG